MDDLKKQIKEAMKKDFNKLYVKEFTMDWKEQRFIREIEIDIMGIDQLLTLFDSYHQKKMEAVADETLADAMTLIDTMRGEKEYLNGKVGETMAKRETLLDVKHRLAQLSKERTK